MAGVARYGALFPTGAQVRLGPVRMLRLTRSVYCEREIASRLRHGTSIRAVRGNDGGRLGADGLTRDLDSPPGIGRMVSTFIARVSSRAGICNFGWSTTLDGTRWMRRFRETSRCSSAGKRPAHWFVSKKRGPTSSTTSWRRFCLQREMAVAGSSRCFHEIRMPIGIELRYRMWEHAEAKPPAKPPVPESVAEPRQAKPPGTPFAKLVTTTLELPGKGREFLLDLDAGRRAVAPEFLRPDEFADTSALRRNKRFAQWCRDQGIDLFSYLPEERPRMVGPRAKAASSKPDSTIIIGLDMIAGRILPETFNELTVEDAREILERQPDYKPRTAWMAVAEDLAERPDTYVFRTREGTVGVLQMEAADKEAGKLKIRYRLRRRN